MTKNVVDITAVFDIAAKVRQKNLDINFTKVVFVGFNSKAEMFHKNIPCEVVAKSYRYILRPKDQIEHSSFYDLLEHSLMVQRTLKEAIESKIVFVVESSSIFNGRGREFTSWLDYIDKSYGSENLLSTSCLVVESVSSDSNPVLELKSIASSSCDRITGQNLKLLNEWLNSEKIALIPRLTKSDLGDYNADPFRKQLDSILSKCETLSRCNSKVFLPADSLDFQEKLYQQHFQALSDKSGKFISELETVFYHFLDQKAKKCNDLDSFKNSYNKILDVLGVNISLLHEFIIALSRLDITNNTLQNIAKEIEILEQKERSIIELMPEISRWYDPEKQLLTFTNKIYNIKKKLIECWSHDISITEEAIKVYLSIYRLCESNETYKSEMKNLGVEFHLGKFKEGDATINALELIKKHEELDTSLKQVEDFYSRNTKLKEVFIKTIESYSDLTALHKISYQSMLKYVQETTPLNVSFSRLYTKHIKDIYDELYSEYREITTKLESAVTRLNVTILATAGSAAAIPILVDYMTYMLTGFPIFTLIAMYGGMMANSSGMGFQNLVLKKNLEQVERYYKQLPKDLRETWAEINDVYHWLSNYLKKKYSEDSTHRFDESEYINHQDQNSEVDERSTAITNFKQPQQMEHNSSLIPTTGALDNRGYDFLAIKDSLIKKGINTEPILGIVEASGQLGMGLDKINTSFHTYIIPLNVNTLDGSFTATNHLALYTYTNETAKITVIKYLNPMGQLINEHLRKSINITGVISEDLTKGKGVQFAYSIDNGIELKGNTDDCVPLLVQLFYELVTYGEVRIKSLNEKKSIEFGQQYRKEQSYRKGEILEKSNLSTEKKQTNMLANNVVDLQSYLDQCLSGGIVITQDTSFSLQRRENNKIQWHDIHNTADALEEDRIIEQFESLTTDSEIELVESKTISLSLAGAADQVFNDSDSQ